MKITRLLAVLLLLALFTTSAMAATIKVPAKNPVLTVNIPNSWEPERTDKGVACESPDKVATIFFEVVKSEKGMNKLIDANIDWLLKDQGVKIDSDSKQEKEVSVGGIASSLIGFDANSKEFGPAKVGFIFTPIGGKLLVTTYWISVKGYAKHDATVTKILDSIKPIDD